MNHGHVGPSFSQQVHAPLSRSLAVYDVADILDSHDFITKRLEDISTVATDKLSVDVLRGKQLFYNSADVRMSDQGFKHGRQSTGGKADAIAAGEEVGEARLVEVTAVIADR